MHRQSQAANAKTNALLSYHMQRNKTKNRAALIQGKGQTSEAERWQQAAQNDQAWSELVYNRNSSQHRLMFEKMLRNCQIAAHLMPSYDTSSYWHAIFKNSETALQQEPQTRDQSPNQRRAALAPLLDLIDIAYALTGALDNNALHTIARYGTGVQIVQAAIRFLELPLPIWQSTIQIISGESLRQCAKHYQIQENQLRSNIIYAGKLIHRIAECDTDSIGIQIPQSIPDLRSPQYQNWGHIANIFNAYKYAMQNIVQPFELTYALSLTQGIPQKFQALHKKIMQQQKQTQRTDRLKQAA